MSRRPKQAGWRGPRIGPGTAIALALCGIAVVLGRTTRGPHVPGGHTWRSGMERRASEREPAPAAEPAPLVKPDAQTILDRADSLGLTPAQRAAVRRVQAEWAKEKARLSSAMEASVAPVRAQAQGSVEGVACSLEGYSALSRAFDVRRREAWRAARRILTPAQLRELDRGAPWGGEE